MAFRKICFCYQTFQSDEGIRREVIGHLDESGRPKVTNLQRQESILIEAHGF